MVPLTLRCCSGEEMEPLLAAIHAVGIYEGDSTIGKVRLLEPLSLFCRSLWGKNDLALIALCGVYRSKGGTPPSMSGSGSGSGAGAIYIQHMQ